MLHELHDWTLDNCTITDMKARIRAVQLHMQQFELMSLLDVGSQSATTYCLHRKSIFFPEVDVVVNFTRECSSAITVVVFTCTI